jgi:tetratricopeptide (TPR) repeat protein
LESVSSELAWKLLCEAAEAARRAECFGLARRHLSRAALEAPHNLRWRVWLCGARLELVTGRVGVAKQLLERAKAEAPRRFLSTVWLEESRLYEFCGDTQAARQVIRAACQAARLEWKVFLESVSLEVRAGDLGRAVTAAEEALQVHPTTGRIWAALIHLKQVEGEQAQLQVFRRAIAEVPKSGEVWCEGARIALNPSYHHFNLKAAKRCLDFAVQFTPQYGDSIVEFARLEMLLRGRRGVAACGSATDADGDGDSDLRTLVGRSVRPPTPPPSPPLPPPASSVEQRAVNADPNYGAAWFYCRLRCANPCADVQEILQSARAQIAADLDRHHALYQRALMRSLKLSAASAHQVPRALAEAYSESCMTRVSTLVPPVADLEPSERFQVLYDPDPVCT